MHAVVKGSLVLAAAVAVVSVLFFVTGFHRNFMLSQVVFLVAAIALNVGVLVWALGKTAATSGYGRQLLHAAGIGLLGGALVVAVSWLLLAVVFPDATAEAREGAIVYMKASGTPQAEFDRQLEMLAKATPMSQSLQGGVGTLVTSVVAGAIVAIWKRRR